VGKLSKKLAIKINTIEDFLITASIGRVCWLVNFLAVCNTNLRLFDTQKAAEHAMRDQSGSCLRRVGRVGLEPTTTEL
jgi:hypothetical protein